MTMNANPKSRIRIPRTQFVACILNIAVVLASAWPLWVGAGTFEIPWHTVDGGGGSSTSADGRFRISGTAGQPDAALLDGAEFDLFGGFWYPQIACDCYLTIERMGENVIVNWPIAFSGCTLETTSALGSTVWTPVATSISGGVCFYSAPIAAAPKFFRLSGL
jgi:hypothetical protein